MLGRPQLEESRTSLADNPLEEAHWFLLQVLPRGVSLLAVFVDPTLAALTVVAIVAGLVAAERRFLPVAGRHCLPAPGGYPGLDRFRGLANGTHLGGCDARDGSASTASSRRIDGSCTPDLRDGPRRWDRSGGRPAGNRFVDG